MLLPLSLCVCVGVRLETFPQLLSASLSFVHFFLLSRHTFIPRLSALFVSSFFPVSFALSPLAVAAAAAADGASNNTASSSNAAAASAETRAQQRSTAAAASQQPTSLVPDLPVNARLLLIVRVASLFTLVLCCVAFYVSLSPLSCGKQLSEL